MLSFELMWLEPRDQVRETESTKKDVQDCERLKIVTQGFPIHVG